MQSETSGGKLLSIQRIITDEDSGQRNIPYAIN
jgi:hypothetical protein